MVYNVMAYSAFKINYSILNPDKLFYTLLLTDIKEFYSKHT